MDPGLVLVPGHGVCMHPAAAQQDESWLGVYPGEAAHLVEHARAGVREAAKRGAVLMFSGGQTRAEAGPRSEAMSYLELAESAAWWGQPELAERVLLEEYARDSLENLRFALARFRQVHAADPSELVVCGWRFKAKRFALHARALGWDAPFTYLGVNDPPAGAALIAARQGEAKKCAALASDPELNAPEHQKLRQHRNPFQRAHPY